MSTHPAQVDQHLSLAKADLRRMIEDANKRNDGEGALAWTRGLALLEEVHRELAKARQKQNWSRDQAVALVDAAYTSPPPSSLSQMGTHDANCPKAFDHSKACTCVLASNYVRDPAMAYPCSNCRAQPNEACHDNKGSMGHAVHSERLAMMTMPAKHEAVEHPSHYGGADNVYETIKVIKAWGLGFSLGNAVKYISRAGKKDQAGASKREAALVDLRKARFYIDDEITELSK